MSLVSVTLTHLARHTRSSLDAFARRAPLPVEAEPGEDGLVYRLKHWPTLPSAIRTADVLRLLSVMSHRAVNRRWIRAHTRLEAAQIESLLRRLVAHGDAEVIDLRGLRPAA